MEFKNFDELSREETIEAGDLIVSLVGDNKYLVLINTIGNFEVMHLNSAKIYDESFKSLNDIILSIFGRYDENDFKIIKSKHLVLEYKE